MNIESEDIALRSSCLSKSLNTRGAQVRVEFGLIDIEARSEAYERSRKKCSQ
jgi:hypothetical protein